ncbi:hypothetical protein FE249_18370 (plasmid) [Acidiphilium multivorum]|uniref:hypothetical protein n=1 Tax=Acidiphilium multivorum TaxID=62140 RepID=UPI001F4BF499|nr:hypothetical protein [Acidiphilium multivorum]UNC16220.1 hypothetical protein FE249_18370 [Acidiphilium multivorum]
MDIKATITKAELITTKMGVFVVISGRSPHYGVLADEPSNIVAGLGVPSVEAGDAVLESLRNNDRNDLVGTAVLICGTILHEHSKPGRLALTARELKRMTGHELVAYRQAEHFAEAMIHIQEASRANDAQRMLELLRGYGASIGWSDRPAEPLPGFSAERAAASEIQAGKRAAASPSVESAEVAEKPVPTEQVGAENNADESGAPQTGVQQDTPAAPVAPVPRPVPANRPPPITEEPPMPGDTFDIADPLGLGNLGFDAPTP